MLAVQILLHLVEVAKLASAVSSRRVPEMPCRHLSQIVARRNGLMEGCRVRVNIDEREIGLHLTLALCEY
jgi:hypothetical protein